MTIEFCDICGDPFGNKPDPDSHLKYKLTIEANGLYRIQYTCCVECVDKVHGRCIKKNETLPDYVNNKYFDGKPIVGF